PRQAAAADLEEGSGDCAAARGGSTAVAEMASEEDRARAAAPGGHEALPRALGRATPSAHPGAPGLARRLRPRQRHDREVDRGQPGKGRAGECAGAAKGPNIPKLDLPLPDPEDGVPAELCDDEAPAPPDPTASELVSQALDSGSASEPRPPAQPHARQKRTEDHRGGGHRRGCEAEEDEGSRGGGAGAARACPEGGGPAGRCAGARARGLTRSSPAASRPGRPSRRSSRPRRPAPSRSSASRRSRGRAGRPEAEAGEEGGAEPQGPGARDAAAQEVSGVPFFL
ncbi:unnamed protein product, partial [Prorocentrum cordatum]